MSSDNFEIMKLGAERRTLSDEVAARLRAEILEGVFAPGQKLAMSDLTQRYGVGLSPIREALSRLEGEAIVQREGQRGFRAAAMSREDFAEIVFLRQMVEETAIRAAIRRGDDRWEASVVAAFHLLERRTASMKAGNGDLADYELAHKVFHTAIGAGAGLKRLSALQLRLYDEARRYRLHFYRRYLGKEGFGWDGAITEHRRILDAIVRRDANQAAEILRNHVTLISDFDLEQPAPDH
jgi:GntR family carbon starvation induced transcriptional regulator